MQQTFHDVSVSEMLKVFLVSRCATGKYFTFKHYTYCLFVCFVAKLLTVGIDVTVTGPLFYTLTYRPIHVALTCLMCY